MRNINDAKLRIKRMARKVKDLQQRAQELEAQHKTLAVQHHVLACCCDLMHWMRSSAMHKGWKSYRDAVEPEEVLLLQELSTHPIHEELSNPQHQPKLLQLQDDVQWGEQQQQEDEEGVGYGRQPVPLTMMQAAGSWDAVLFTPEAAAALATSVPGIIDSVDPRILYLTAAGDFLGAYRECLSQPPYPGGNSMSLQELGQIYINLVETNWAALRALQQALLQQQAMQRAGMGSGGWQQGAAIAHPVAVLRQRLMQHTALIATVWLLHPDDLLNRFRLLNHHTMQLEECTADQVWSRMYDAVGKLQLTEQQQQLIAKGVEMYTRLLQAVMEERVALTARQQQLLKVDNGRSIDIEQQQQCADRLNVVVRKERFLAQCLGTHVAGVCSVVQIAKLSLLTWPWSPQIAMFGKAVAKRVQERQEEREQRRQQRRQQRQLQQLLPVAAAVAAATGAGWGGSGLLPVGEVAAAENAAAGGRHTRRSASRSSTDGGRSK